MTIDQEDLRMIVEALAPIIEAQIEQLRGEMQATVEVLDGNDLALVGELQKVKGMTAAEVLTEAGESWERFIVGEAKHLGLRIVKEKNRVDLTAKASNVSVTSEIVPGDKGEGE